MNYLSVENLSHSFGPVTLFEKLSFGVNRGERVALIAKNGAGKSTLMKILAGKITPDEGQFVFKQNLRTAYLPQDPFFPPDKTVMQCLMEYDSPQKKALEKYQKALANPDDEKELQRAFQEMEVHDAWSLESRVNKLLSMVRLSDLGQKSGNLSSGQRKRVALAAAVLEEPDLLFLDEITNHLDMEMIEWLEGFLLKSQLTLFMITHDRRFLDRVCNKIIELDENTLHTYQGNYAYYLEKKLLRQEAEQSTRKKNLNLYRKELEWMRRQPKARGTKSKGRIKLAEDIGIKTHAKKDSRIEFAQMNVKRIGGKILNLYNLRKSFGEKKIVGDFTYFFQKEDRIGIVGKNGAGKSTLLRMILGREKPDGGKIVPGETLNIGCFSQENEDLDDRHRILETVREVADFIPLKKGKTLSAEQLLERFMFPRHRHRTLVEKLSGGEKRRLMLLKVLMENPNFLILDEPTNDLDLISLAVLEEFLSEFPGCLLVVSHDRFFLEKVSNRLFVFEGEGKVIEYHGTLDDYKTWKNAEAKEENQLPATKTHRKQKHEKPKNKLSNREKSELERLEKEIDELDTQKNEIQKELENFEGEYTELNRLTKRLNSILADLETKENRWLELGVEL